jgi:hypothetical protein
MRKLSWATIVISLAPTLLSANAHDWREGIVLSVSDQGFTTHSNTTTTNGTVQGGNIHATTQQYSWNHQRWTYGIDAGEQIFVASHVLSFRWSKPCKVTINGPVKFAVEKNKLYLLDEDGHEHKLDIDRRILKAATAPPSTPPPPVAVEPSSRESTGGQITMGMSRDEVRQLLGAPPRDVTFETKTRWTYPDVVVLFEDGKVIEVRFP